MAKVYDNATDLITFARGSSATYTGSDGTQQTAASDEPRIEYAADGTLKGLLIEEQRTNLLLNSANPDTQVATLPAGSHTLSFVGGPSATGISDTITATAVDVFVYDTSKDSDGGAWRTGSLAQASSWYNETLNTSTRGSRREFPAVAVIVAESNKVTIYDGDDPSLPMWMVFEGGTGNALYNASVTGVACLNGKLIASLNSAMFSVSFLEDALQIQQTGGTRVFIDPISGRSSGNGYAAAASGGEIVNNAVNDVAMTVLPDAPTDPATGLPVPTIAVATDGGVSVINNDGTVYDSSYTGGLSDVGFWADGTVVYGRGGFTAQALRAEPSAYQIADGFGTYILHGSLSLPNYFPYQSGTLYLPFGDNEVAGGNPSGTTSTNSIPCLGRYVIGSTLPQSMGCVTTSSYTTGWMPGDIKLAALADTTAETLSGTPLLDDDFGTYADTAAMKSAGWSSTSSTGTGDISLVSGAMQLDSNGTSNRARGSRSFTTFPGRTYVVEYSATGQATNNHHFRVGTAENGTQSLEVLNRPAGSLVSTFVATDTTTYVTWEGFKAAGSETQIDNISVRLADPDRSVNGNGLGVHGSITKTAVATGADVVGYSGFSASNYLETSLSDMPSSNTDELCMMGWFKPPDGSSGIFVGLDIPTSASSGVGVFGITKGWANGSSGAWAERGTNVGGNFGKTTVIPNQWQHVAAIRRSTGTSLYINGKLESSTTEALATSASPTLRVGGALNGSGSGDLGYMALLRISATAPTADQIAKIYNDEKLLFQENAKATLTGSSDAVTALAHDPDTNLLHVGTSGGRSVFYGLRRVNETATAVTTAISAVDGLIVEQ